LFVLGFNVSLTLFQSFACKNIISQCKPLFGNIFCYISLNQAQTHLDHLAEP